MKAVASDNRGARGGRWRVSAMSFKKQNIHCKKPKTLENKIFSYFIGIAPYRLFRTFQVCFLTFSHFTVLLCLHIFNRLSTEYM